jgi:predicted DNA-binding transcriptional regulator YafY
MPTMPDEPWLTKKELADALKVSTRTIERAKLPCLVVGRQNRYRLSEVETALRSMASASDRIEVVLTLTEKEYQELGENLQAIRDQGRPPSTATTALILESVAYLAEHGTPDEG